MSSRSRPVGAGPSFSVILLAGATYVSPPAALLRGQVAEVIPLVGAFDALAAGFADAVERATGDLVFAVTPDALPSDAVWRALADAVAGHPDAGAFRLKAHGLKPERAWRGRRCQAHERNLESLRFAHLVAPGSLVARRDMIDAAAAGLAPGLGADWWRG